VAMYHPCLHYTVSCWFTYGIQSLAIKDLIKFFIFVLLREVKEEKERLKHVIINQNVCYIDTQSCVTYTCIHRPKMPFLYTYMMKGK